MHEKYILSCIKRTNRNLMIVSLLIFIVVVITVSFSANYLYNVFLGPFDIDTNTLTSITNTDSLQKYYVTVNAEDSLETGLSYVRETIDERTKKVKSTSYDSDYLLLLVGEKALVAKVPYGTKPGKIFSGALAELPSDVEYELTQIAKEQGIADQDFKNRLLPVMLDVNDFKTAGYVEVTILLILLLIVLFCVISFMKSSTDMYRHSIFKKLALYGEVEAVENEINNAFSSPNTKIIGKVTVAGPWISIKKAFSTQFVKSDDVLWIYKKITKHSYNFIPTGKSYELLVYFRNKSVSVVKMKEKHVDSAIDSIYQVAPWVVVGYSDDINSIWKKQFDTFVSEVESRKNSYINK